MRLLFFGDSLTDMGRNRKKGMKYASSYGLGFVFHIASRLMKEEPGMYEIINRGIGGNKITSLYRRYKNDVIREEPDVVTILIGVNDLFGKYRLPPGFGVPVEKYKKIYIKMVEDIKKAYPNVRVILMEPFYLEGKLIKRYLKRFEELKDYQKAVEEVAKETESEFVSLQAMFNEVGKDRPSNYLYDGLHTSPAGALLIAEKWLENFKK